MKLLRHTFVILTILSFPMGLFSQTDTACVSKRWISVKNTEHNAVLFDTTTSILKTIRELVHENKISLYHEQNLSFGFGSWYPIPLIQRDSNFIDYKEYGSDIYNGLFTLRIESDVPFVDEYGDPIVITLEDGNQEFKYPEPEVHAFSLMDIIEVRIREEIYDYRADGAILDDFQPTGISFFVRDGQFGMRELFWVSLIELEDNASDIHLNSWYTFIKSGSYRGFQYMQVSCYDDLIRY